MTDRTALKMPERTLQSAVMDLAHLLKWRTYHTYDSRRSNAGFPDIVAVRGSRTVFIELKSDKGILSPEQADWGAALLAAGQEWYEFRPQHWHDGTVERVLRGAS